VFVIDNVLLLWARGLVCVCREIEKAAAQEAGRGEEALRRELGDLYRSLEKKEITEEMFSARESELLARLEERESRTPEARGASRRVKVAGGG